MKKNMLIILGIFIWEGLQSQETVVLSVDTLKLRNGSYYFKHSLPAEYSPQKLGNTATPIVSGRKIKILYQLNDSIYYNYWNFNSDSDSVLRKSLNEGRVFSMHKNTFNQLTGPIYRRYKGVEIGAYTVPFRLRDLGGDNFDFESSLSLQTNLAFGFGSRKNQESFVDYSLGIGVSSINLTKNNSKVDAERTASALTVSFGGVIKPAKYANIGVFFGWDFLGANDQDIDWDHNGKMWVGIGLNVSFNVVKTEKSAIRHNNK